MDNGSGRTLLEAELEKELGLKGTPEGLCLRWTSGITRQENDSKRVDENGRVIRTTRTKHQSPVTRGKIFAFIQSTVPRIPGKTKNPHWIG